MKRILGILLTVLVIIILVAVISVMVIKNTVTEGLSNQPVATTTINNADASTTPIVDKHPLLSPAQEKTLENFGINPSSLPQSLTPELRACAEGKLSPARIEEIKNGSTPTISDFMAIRGCL